MFCLSCSLCSCVLQAVNVMPLSPADGANQEQDSELKAAHPVPAEDDGNHALEISETAKTPSVAVAVVKAPPGEEGAVFTVRPSLFLLSDCLVRQGRWWGLAGFFLPQEVALDCRRAGR